MDIYSLIKLVGGLAFFLYGMNVMSDGLEKSSDGKIEKYLGTITKNKFFALIFGALLTIAVQSSSAVTVMLVGLVNSGMLQFGQTIGVLMGSNIGTTVTAWITNLAFMEGGGNFFLWLFDTDTLAPIVDDTRKKLEGIAKSDEDVLSYIAFPNLAEKFFEERKAKEENEVTYTIVEA